MDSPGKKNIINEETFTHIISGNQQKNRGKKITTNAKISGLMAPWHTGDFIKIRF